MLDIEFIIYHDVGKVKRPSVVTIQCHTPNYLEIQRIIQEHPLKASP